MIMLCEISQMTQSPSHSDTHNDTCKQTDKQTNTYTHIQNFTDQTVGATTSIPNVCYNCMKKANNKITHC